MECVKDFLFSEKCQTTKNVAAVIGLLYVSSVVLKNLWLLKGAVAAYVLTPLTRKNLKKYGSWAVVTGASDGIGKGYAKELARQGLNLVLLSRTQSKLEEVAREIKEESKVEVRIVAVDFCRGQELYEEIRAQLRGLDIGVLINNVGMAYDFPMYLHEVSDDRAWKVVTCNTVAMTMMSKMVLPGMLEKKKGVIVNISSGLGDVPAPLGAAYTASKAFVNYFSKCLQNEYASKGITVQNVAPHFVCSNMTKMKRPNMNMPTADNYARSAVATIGILGNTNGYWAHSLMGWIAMAMPEWMAVHFVSSTVFKLRARGMKKMKEKGQ